MIKQAVSRVVINAVMIAAELCSTGTASQRPWCSHQ